MFINTDTNETYVDAVGRLEYPLTVARNQTLVNVTIPVNIPVGRISIYMDTPPDGPSIAVAAPLRALV